MPEKRLLQIDGQDVTFYIVRPPALALGGPPRSQKEEEHVVARTTEGAISVSVVGPGAEINDFDDATLKQWYRTARAMEN